MKSITYNSTFVRYEKKYILTAEQYRQLSSALEDYTMLDEYGKTDIYTIYYDTPDFLLVRRSMEKPIFKEKLRLRIYGKPENFSAAFVEIKRKYDKTVYKRRFSRSYAEALAYFQNPIGGDTQIAKEICYALHCYPKIQPAMVIMYTRISKIGKDDPSLRITFDSDIHRNFRRSAPSSPGKPNHGNQSRTIHSAVAYAAAHSFFLLPGFFFKIRCGIYSHDPRKGFGIQAKPTERIYPCISFLNPLSEPK